MCALTVICNMWSVKHNKFGQQIDPEIAANQENGDILLKLQNSPTLPYTEGPATADCGSGKLEAPKCGCVAAEGGACFICNQKRQDGLINIFHTEAIRTQLRQRLEGVLDVTLKESQPSGNTVCGDCRKTLINIETMATELRRVYHSTLSIYKLQQNIEMREAESGKHNNSIGLHLGSHLGCEVETVSRGTITNESQGVTLTYLSLSTTAKDTVIIARPNSEVAIVDRKELAESREATSKERLFDGDTESETEPECLSTEQDDLGKIHKHVYNESQAEISETQKHTKLEIILVEEEISPSFGDVIHDNVLEEKPVIKRNRGRPKGSKNQTNTINNVRVKTAGVFKIKPRKRLKRDIGGNCDNCDKVFNSNYKLNRHMLIHSDDRPFGCPHCKQQFKAKYHLDRHLQIHTGLRPHHCLVCSASFRERHQLTEHQLIHTGDRPHICNICEQRFQKANALKLHIYDHTGGWPFKCSICNAGFARERELEDHGTVHSGEKRFLCKVCGSRFRLANTLKVHMRLHTGLKPYACKLCNTRFTAANTLKEHTRTHSGLRKFLCHTCGAAFVHQSGLLQHSKTHLAMQDRKHVCHICQRRFTELSLLKRHGRMHTGERPYMCSKCGKAFRRPGELSMHNRYHSNDRRHVCAMCDKSFFTKSHLKRHETTHREVLIKHNEAPLNVTSSADEVKLIVLKMNNQTLED